MPPKNWPAAMVEAALLVIDDSGFNRLLLKRRLVELGHMLGHLRRRHGVSHAQCAEADRRQRGSVPGDFDGEAVQHRSLPSRLRHQSDVNSAIV